MEQKMVATKVKNVFDEPGKDRIRLYRKRYGRGLNSLKNKKIITVGFQIIHRSIWKYDRLYQLMDQDPNFEPFIFVCPYLRESQEHMLEEMNATFKVLHAKGYNVIKTYDEENDYWIDIKSKL